MKIAEPVFCGAGAPKVPQRPVAIKRSVMAVMISIAGIFALLLSPVRAQEVSELFAAHNPNSTLTVDHDPFAALLEKYLVVSEDGVNRFKYGGVTTEDRTALKNYIGALANVQVADLNRSEQFAYWANLYNAATLEVVLDAYPVKSIRQIKPTLISIGPWKKEVVTVGGKALSLDDIEHGILRKVWSDPRVHYSVNCASIGCPNLRSLPFTGATLDADLDAAARDFVNHPRAVTVKDGKLTVSSIYKWFQVDFGGSDAGVIAHLKKYADSALAIQLDGVKKISKDSYDWALNDAQ